MLNGFYRDGVVYLHRDLGGSGSVVGGRQALSDRLVKVALEEVSPLRHRGHRQQPGLPGLLAGGRREAGPAWRGAAGQRAGQACSDGMNHRDCTLPR